MNVTTMISRAKADYTADLVAWTAEQSAFLRAGRFDSLDIEHLVEELASLGNSERNEIGSHFETLIEHLLKLRHSTAANPRRGWLRSVENARDRIARVLRRNPSLKRELADLLASGRTVGARDAAGALLDHGEIDERQAMLIEADTVELSQALGPDFDAR